MAVRNAGLGHPLHTLPAAAVCLGIGVYGAMTAWITPISARVNYDPSLQYMLSSLAWFRGGTYDYIDHPGTPVEVLGTLVLGLLYPLSASAPEGFITAQLTHPQLFLSVAQTLVVAASMVVCVCLAWRSVGVQHWTQALVGAGLAGLFFVLLPEAFGSLALWSHESFCFAGGTLVSLLLLLAMRRTGRPTWGVVLGLGFTAGVLTSVQLYFAAWVIGTAVAFLVAARLSGLGWRRSSWRAAAPLLASTLGFVVATVPIHDRYRQFGGWIRLLISHQGNYGSGASGFSSPELMAGNLGTLVEGAPLLFTVCGLSLLCWLWQAWRSRLEPQRHELVWSAGAGFVAQVLVLLVMVAKHPGEKYLLPVAATLPLLLATVLSGLDTRDRWSRVVLGGLGLVLLAGFVAALASALAAHATLAANLQHDDAATELTLSRLAQEKGIDRGALRTLWTYGTTSPCYALWFGDDSAENLFRADIGRLCPRDANLNVWSAEVTSSTGTLSLAEDEDWDVAVLGQDMARLNPGARPAGPAYASSIPSLGYGPLLFVSPGYDRATSGRTAPQTAESRPASTAPQSRP